MTERPRTRLHQFIKALIDAPAIPRVHEAPGSRCLRFNNGVVQSSMRTNDPVALDLSYTRAMMGFLLFNPAPRRILIVGLGGGSLSKFCYHTLPHSHITSIEIDSAVIALREEFQIPPDNERFQIVCADAGEYLTRDNLQADIILLDAYDASGLPSALCSEAFYARCAQVLTPQGVLVANLWGGEPNRVVYLDRLRGVFNERVWWARPTDSSSLIVYAANGAPSNLPWTQMLSQAQALDAHYRLNLMQAVNDMRTPLNVYD